MQNLQSHSFIKKSSIFEFEKEVHLGRKNCGDKDMCIGQTIFRKETEYGLFNFVIKVRGMRQCSHENFLQHVRLVGKLGIHARKNAIGSLQGSFLPPRSHVLVVHTRRKKCPHTPAPLYALDIGPMTTEMLWRNELLSGLQPSTHYISPTFTTRLDHPVVVFLAKYQPALCRSLP